MSSDNSFILNLQFGITNDLFANDLISESQKNKCLKTFKDEYTKATLKETSREKSSQLAHGIEAGREQSSLLAHASGEVS